MRSEGVRSGGVELIHSSPEWIQSKVSGRRHDAWATLGRSAELRSDVDGASVMMRARVDLGSGGDRRRGQLVVAMMMVVVIGGFGGGGRWGTDVSVAEMWSSCFGGDGVTERRWRWRSKRTVV